MAKKQLKEHVINREWCKGCGICVYFCPKKVLEMDEQDKAYAARPEDCICCQLCEIRCPDLAIEILIEHQDKHKDNHKDKDKDKDKDKQQEAEAA